MRYEFWIDRGGTFTDCILLDHQTGKRTVLKVLSSDEAPLIGMRQLLGLSADEPIPPCQVRMGTTVATNALLERRGTRSALVITEGFADLLEIGDQTRPDLFELDIDKSENLYSAVREIPARLDADGAIVSQPDEGCLTRLACELAKDRVESVALCVIHAYANPRFEMELAHRLRRSWPKGSLCPHVVASSELTGEMGFLGRTSTAVLDSYLTPLLRNYLETLQTQLPGSRVSMMQSSGGLASTSRFRGPAAVLSGPAGGVIAAARVRKSAGPRSLVTFDMGGTSTDVALIEDEPPTIFEKNIAGVRVRAPMLDIHTVAAGGGSICEFDGYGLRVGPESVGASPGPLCYANTKGSGNSPLALTDVNLILGRLSDAQFPFPLQRDVAEDRLKHVALKVSKASGVATSVRQLARGFAAVATANMAEAIRTVTIAKGVDPADTDLLVFGGAAGQHACSVASALGIRRIYAHRLSGVLSAYGMGLADRMWNAERDAGRQVLGSGSEADIGKWLVDLVEQGTQALRSEGARKEALRASKQLSLRYVGTDTTDDVKWDSLPAMRHEFENKYQRRFGYIRPEASLEIVALRVSVSERRQLPDSLTDERSATRPLPHPKFHSHVTLDDGQEAEVPVFELDSLSGTPPVQGPALILDATATYFVDKGFDARLAGDLLAIDRSDENLARPTEALNPAAQVQIMATHFAGIATQMGEALRRTASSTNIVDRLDFSCALFDAEGNLIANAPHIPVHLGAMGESVRAVLLRHPKLRPGDSFVTNDPSLGGSHLPDITVVTPGFSSDGRLLFVTASRGHHADVGGVTPGSMPPFSTSLAEEGIVLSAEPLVSEGRLKETEILAHLMSGPHPARKVGENMADLQAQLAANQLGASLLQKLIARISEAEVLSAMGAVRSLASRWMRDAIKQLPPGPFLYTDALDDGTRIRVEVRRAGEELVIDFSGTDQATHANQNAPRAVTIACVLYVLRTLLSRPLPLNEGCLEPVELRIPTGSLLDPPQGRAVAAGNVETSQRIVDVLLGALNLAAASQGTMNNLSFGNAEFGYYETIAGGAGAGPTFSGAHAVHTHMTNTRITDPETLESTCPVRLVRFCVRRGSGGLGRNRGGDGVVREIEALAPLQISLLTNRRTSAPFGLEGGGAGKPGKNWIAGKEVSSCASARLEPGQTLRIETPGGGGYGATE